MITVRAQDAGEKKHGGLKGRSDEKDTNEGQKGAESEGAEKSSRQANLRAGFREKKERERRWALRV